MSTVVLLCGKVFDGLSDTLTGPAEILVEDQRIAQVGPAVRRPPGAQVIDLSVRTVSPGFIDTHVHLTMDAAHLARMAPSTAPHGLSPTTWDDRCCVRTRVTRRLRMQGGPAGRGPRRKEPEP